MTLAKKETLLMGRYDLPASAALIVFLMLFALTGRRGYIWVRPILFPRTLQLS
jgi:hypothetical protein